MEQEKKDKARQRAALHREKNKKTGVKRETSVSAKDKNRISQSAKRKSQSRDETAAANEKRHFLPRQRQFPRLCLRLHQNKNFGLDKKLCTTRVAIQLRLFKQRWLMDNTLRRQTLMLEPTTE
jgi:hypothetical protein